MSTEWTFEETNEGVQARRGGNEVDLGDGWVGDRVDEGRAIEVVEALVPALDIEGGEGKLPRSAARSRLVETGVVDHDIVADAVVAYLVSETMLWAEDDGGTVVVLPDLDAVESPRASANWATAFESGVEQVDETVAELRETIEQLELLRESLQLRSQEFRRAALQQELFPADAVEMAESLDALVAALGTPENVPGEPELAGDLAGETTEQHDDLSSEELLSDATETTDDADESFELED